MVLPSGFKHLFLLSLLLLFFVFPYPQTLKDHLGKGGESRWIVQTSSSQEER